jgi:hypothetical protein
MMDSKNVSAMIDFMKKHKKLLIITTAVVTLTGVAFLYPEHTETVARAFLVIVGAL